MIDDVFVVDATVHGGHFHRDNLLIPQLEELTKLLYHWGNGHLQPFGFDEYKVSYDQFTERFALQPALLESLLFAESDIDVAVYQGVPLYGMYKDGSSPLWVAAEIAKRFPHRMFLYGDLTPRMSDPIAHIDHLVDDMNVIGVKMYPLDMVEGRLTENRFDDEKLMFPLFEHMLKRGLKVVAVHKAVPLAPALVDRYHVDDMAPAIAAFPDLTFEIVHGGFAFGQEIAALLDRYPNVTVNLESTPCYALNFQDKFAEMMAPLLATGPDRLFFSTGAPIMHPDPFIRAFRDYRMPAGYPPLDDATKRGILGGNFARVHGWDVEALKAACRADQFGLEGKTKTTPWSVIRNSAVGEAA
jgi:predicted TIM-barrel fold metal-dependent hydrolase